MRKAIKHLKMSKSKYFATINESNILYDQRYPIHIISTARGGGQGACGHQG